MQFQVLIAILITLLLTDDSTSFIHALNKYALDKTSLDKLTLDKTTLDKLTLDKYNFNKPTPNISSLNKSIFEYTTKDRSESFLNMTLNMPKRSEVIDTSIAIEKSDNSLNSTLAKPDLDESKKPIKPQSLKTNLQLLRNTSLPGMFCYSCSSELNGACAQEKLGLEYYKSCEYNTKFTGCYTAIYHYTKTLTRGCYSEITTILREYCSRETELRNICFDNSCNKNDTLVIPAYLVASVSASHLIQNIVLWSICAISLTLAKV